MARPNGTTAQSSVVVQPSSCDVIASSRSAWAPSKRSERASDSRSQSETRGASDHQRARRRRRSRRSGRGRASARPALPRAPSRACAARQEGSCPGRSSRPCGDCFNAGGKLERDKGLDWRPIRAGRGAAARRASVTPALRRRQHRGADATPRKAPTSHSPRRTPHEIRQVHRHRPRRDPLRRRHPGAGASHGRRRADVPEQGHRRQRRQLEGPHDAGRRGQGRRPGADAEGRRARSRCSRRPTPRSPPCPPAPSTPCSSPRTSRR